MRLYGIKSWYDSREGMITVEDDVLSVVRQVRELYEDRITVELDPDSGLYHFVEHCDDHTDRLIFSSAELTPKELERLLLADSQGRAYQDPYDAAEREQDEFHANAERANSEKVQEMGEQLLYALRREGRAPRLTRPVVIPKDVHA